MKYSIRRQMTAIFIGLFACILGAVLIINNGFLGRYYLSHKTKDLVRTYYAVDAVLQEGSLADLDLSVINGIISRTERANIDIVVTDSSGKSTFSTLAENDPRLSQMIRDVVRQDIDANTVLEQTDSFTIYRSTAGSDLNNVEYLRMWGIFSDGSWFVMQSPLASIRESAALANQFLIYLGGVGIIVGGLLVWLLSRRITQPLMELARLSQEMANLNFDAKYTSGGANEIGILGSNFNRMSEQLENGNVSHELKTPIALIQGYAEGLREGVNDDPESREFYCEVIMDEADKMNRMVKNLLTLNQLEFGSDEVQFERFDIVGLVRGVIASCDILIRQADATVDFIADEKLDVWADEFKTEQVVRNYLTNAIHHVENEKRIEVRIRRVEDKALITVFNSGKPIPGEDLPKLWDKFYKVDKAHTREYGGNGIGLSIVKAIMESFRQQYGVRNFDNGVEFWFELDAKTENTSLH